ncbi:MULTISPECIES: hypothetical protein [Staphylococcus]|uniref:hypothetical protein n=1 Tax=Staphylococcus TaxID=1279 RepID=UPI000736B5DB|nr:MULTISPECIES: hypothetical protein [Staphylococcus]KTW08606.1 hypothetical protein NS346_04605 [Staphylococcus warneri]OIS41968.1 hypothetical protein A4A23_11235 [Staphylococcus warneri]OIS43075.1 hypothetical protein A4A24_11705 [Staphylococcus warneri]RIN20378.1 hypothetical protein BU091_00430 [Staphylococcus warneri]UGB05402.1 hypothetical protein LPC11_08150 [Staphylococcus sp. HL28]
MPKLIKILKQAYLISGDLNAEIGKEKIRRHREFIESKTDSVELNNDWYVIGEDINKSMTNFSKRELMYNGR